jgi:hypothetical protein
MSDYVYSQRFKDGLEQELKYAREAGYRKGYLSLNESNPYGYGTDQARQYEDGANDGERDRAARTTSGEAQR